MRNTLLALLLACLFLPTIPATTLATTPYAVEDVQIEGLVIEHWRPVKYRR
jgi:hypothetical protein